MTTALLLAQIFEPGLPGVAPTPAVETWITGSGIPGAAVAAGAGVVAFFVLGKSGRTKHAWAVGGALLALAAAIISIGQMITTTRESLASKAHELVQAAATADEPALNSLLHPEVRVRTRFGSGEGRADVVSLSQRAAGFIEEAGIKRSAIDPRGSQVARTLVTIRLTATNLPRLSQWAFDWQRATPESDWRVVSIEPIWIQGFENPAGSP